MPSSNKNLTIPTVACLGEVLIDFIAEETGPLIKASSFQKCPGGAPANVAVGIARLGVSCGFIGKVSTDAFGEFLVSTLVKNGVNIDGITYTSDAPTALAFINRSTTGDRDFLFYRNICADNLLTEEELPHRWLRKIKYLHLGGVSLTKEPSRQATIRAATIAHQNGAMISFDPNLRLDLWDNDLNQCRTVIHKILAQVDIFLPSEEELAMLMDTENVEKALIAAHELGPSIICVKRGARGSLASEKTPNDEYHRFAQLPYEVQVIDTTGAGDGFDAGVIVGLTKGRSLLEAVSHGTAVASLVITKLGAMTALPTKEELMKFLQNFKESKD